jgi:HEAT repeat protein
MSGVLGRFRRPLERRLKLKLAGEDPAALAKKRDRRKLRWLAGESDDPALRFRSLRHLSELIDPESVELFSGIVQAEPGRRPAAEVRTAAEGLGRLMNGDRAALLRRLLDPERPAGVQLAAARGLATVGRAEDWAAVRAWCAGIEGTLLPAELDCAAPILREPPGTTALVWVLQALYVDKSASWWSKKGARWLAGSDPVPRLKSDVGADRIVAQAHRRALGHEQMNDARFGQVVLQLGSMARDRDQELLAAQLDGLDGDRRHSVLSALGLHGDIRSVPLLRAASDQVPADRADQAAGLARAAGRLGWPELAGSLLGLRARFEQREVRLEIAWALGECGGPVAVGALVDQVCSREQRLSEDELAWTIRSVARCGRPGREAVRGVLATGRAMEKRQVGELADALGLSR